MKYSISIRQETDGTTIGNCSPKFSNIDNTVMEAIISFSIHKKYDIYDDNYDGLDIIITNNNMRISIKDIILTIKKTFDDYPHIDTNVIFNFITNNHICGMIQTEDFINELSLVASFYTHNLYAIKTENDAIIARLMGYKIIYNPIKNVMDRFIDF